MSLEEALNANTAELAKFNANFAAFKASQAAAAPAEAPKAETKAKAEPKQKAETKPAVSFDEMKAALLKVKDAKGKDAAQALIKDVGGAEKMGDIAKDKFAAVMAAATAALAEPEATAAAEDDL